MEAIDLAFFVGIGFLGYSFGGVLGAAILLVAVPTLLWIALVALE